MCQLVLTLERAGCSSCLVSFCSRTAGASPNTSRVRDAHVVLRAVVKRSLFSVVKELTWTSDVRAAARWCVCGVVRLLVKVHRETAVSPGETGSGPSEALRQEAGRFRSTAAFTFDLTGPAGAAQLRPEHTLDCWCKRLASLLVVFNINIEAVLCDSMQNILTLGFLQGNFYLRCLMCFFNRL